MVGCKLKEHEFEQILEDGEGQGTLACCSPWGCKDLDMTQQLNNNKNKEQYLILNNNKGKSGNDMISSSNFKLQ